MIGTMIKESKAAQKIPSISTSEDSHEVQQQPLPLSDYCSPAAESTSETHSATADSDESRDMGETIRQIAHKPPTDRDDSTCASGDQKLSVACATMPTHMNVDKYIRRGDPNGNVRMTTGTDKIQDAKETTVAKDSMSIESVNQGYEAKKIGSSFHFSSVMKETPHSLLPSPSASFDPAMDGQPCSHGFSSHYGGAAGSTVKQMPKPRHRRSPAATVRFSYCF